MKKLIFTLALCLVSTGAWAQCNGVFGANTVCGSVAGGIPGQVSTSILTGVPGGSPGQVQFNSAGAFGGLTNAQLTALINPFSSTLSGAVPASGGSSTSLFLNQAGGFTAPPYPVTSVFTRTGAVAATSGDYNAGQITYTPVGTGGVATTDKAVRDRIVWVNDYGAVCDGTTNDATAFQNAINQGQTSGRPVRWIGNCAINSGLSITGSLDFGSFSGGIYTGQSRLTVTSASVLGITVTTANGNPVNFHDFGMQYSPAANAGVAAITITGTASNENSGSVLERLYLNGGIAIGVDFVKASSWRLVNSTIVSSLAASTAIRIANTNNGDSGDNTVYGNLIQQTGGSGVGITWNSSGGTRIENNKILGVTMANGIALSLANGVVTSDIFIDGNSIEGLATSGISVNIVRSGTTGGLNHIVIGHNELGGGQVCVSVPTDANGTWINNINITGNTCQNVNTSSAIGFNINSAVGIVVTNNNYWATGAGTNQVVAIGASATAANCITGFNSQVGTMTASTFGSCTHIAPPP